MHLVDEVYLEATDTRHVLDVIQQFTHVINTSTRSRINLYQVDAAPLGNLDSAAAGAAWFRGNTCFTIQATRENPRYGRLANTARSCKKVGMVKSFIIQGINERLQNVCLAFQFLNDCRPILPGENLITHDAIVRARVRDS